MRGIPIFDHLRSQISGCAINGKSDLGMDTWNGVPPMPSPLHFGDYFGSIIRRDAGALAIAWKFSTIEIYQHIANRFT